MLVKRTQARLTLEELHEIKWLMGSAMTLLAFWSLAGMEDGSVVFLFFATFLVSAALLNPRWVGRIPAKIWRYVGAILFLGMAFDFISNIPNFIPSLVRLMIGLLVFRIWAPRRRREDLQIILLSLFCLVISGVLTLSLLFAIQILLFAPLAMSLLLVICLLDRGEENADYIASWAHFSWAPLLKRIWLVTNFRVVFFGVSFFGFVVVVSTLLFILTPRFNIDRAIPFLQSTAKARSGFSDRVGLNDVTEIQNDYSVALRVDSPSREAIPGRPYWRMLILDEYKAGVFNFSNSMKASASRYEDLTEYTGNVRFSDRQNREWTFYMEGGISSYLPVAGAFDQIRFSRRQDFFHYKMVHVYGLDMVSQSVFAYQVKDLQWDSSFPAHERELSAFSGAVPSVELGSGAQYPYSTMELDVSAEERQVLAAINDEVGFRSVDAVEFSRVTTEYLRSHFGYSLEPLGISGEGDPVISWLESQQVGHCQLFAGAFVLLAREAGFPSRMVVGYAGGSWNSVEDYFVVRNSNAHAWAEIYVAQTGSWLRVDPTPRSGPSDPMQTVRGGFEDEVGFAAWADSLRIQWYRRIVNFDQQAQVEMAATLGDVIKEMVNELKAKMKATLEGLQEWIASPFTGFNVRAASGIFLSAFACFVGWRLRYRMMGFLFWVFRRTAALDPVRRQASRLLKRLRKRAAGTVVGPRWRQDCERLCDELEALRFGPPVGQSDANHTFSETRRALRRPVSL